MSNHQQPAANRQHRMVAARLMPRPIPSIRRGIEPRRRSARAIRVPWTHEAQGLGDRGDNGVLAHVWRHKLLRLRGGRGQGASRGSRPRRSARRRARPRGTNAISSRRLTSIPKGPCRPPARTGAGAPCEKEKESGARDSLPLRGLHKAKGAPRPLGIGCWLLVVDC